MPFKELLLTIYHWPFLPRQLADHYQQIIRDAEWNAIKEFIPLRSSLLDVGCGAGYNMHRAKNELQCIVTGIDPSPGEHGVGRFTNNKPVDLSIAQGEAESLPYPDQSFDVVFSSHMLEHVTEKAKSLQEMKRVLKEDGILIIGMPTAVMALIRLATLFLFTTHIRWFNFFMKPFVKVGEARFKFLFLPPSHSEQGRTIRYDLAHYKIKKWKEIVGNEFHVKQTLLPALYPFPEFRQLFKLRKTTKTASSVFFVCHK